MKTRFETRFLKSQGRFLEDEANLAAPGWKRVHRHAEDEILWMGAAEDPSVLLKLEMTA